jgi:hypothetical protein
MLQQKSTALLIVAEACSTDQTQNNQRPDPFAPLLVDHALGP